MLRPATFTSLHSAADTGDLALCAAFPLPAFEDDKVPEWINLLPAGAIITTVDGRGPYKVPSAAEVVRASLQQAAGPMVLDENHATDIAAARGESAPARGWIVALDARPDGIWGKVDWTKSGLELMADKAYRYISPVITHLKDGTVLEIRRASLVNKPNLRGLAALHQENTMDLLAKLLAALGLPATTTEEAVIAAVTTMHAQQTAASTALQAALDPIATAVGLQAGADATAVLAGVQQVTAKGNDNVVVALQAEIATLASQVKTLTETGSKERATVYVDGEIKRGRAGLKPLRDHYIAMHMADPARVEKEIGAMIVLGPSGARVDPPAPVNGEISLNAEQRATAKMLGIDEKAYAETLKAEREAAL
ncbi:phage protease [Mesorhizobium australicum]|uniref:Mu-like prophage I protein n=1 Tax=Mesorhizobium australicum TaxID=536018 RepID=A0A1X7NXF3_9HYPH|nr:phage protease [Mesorhizobium australicum]SMH42433.1 Mu-like prophage I protein [Mesorhizobium australicum]